MKYHRQTYYDIYGGAAHPQHYSRLRDKIQSLWIFNGWKKMYRIDTTYRYRLAFDVKGYDRGVFSCTIDEAGNILQDAGQRNLLPGWLRDSIIDSIK